MVKRMVYLTGLVILIVACIGSPAHAARAASPVGSPMMPAGGGPIGDTFLVVDASNEQVQSSVAYNSQDEEYLVVYQNEWGGGNKSVAAARVSKGGEVLSIFNVDPGTPSHSPDVAYNPQQNNFLVVWQDDSSGWPSVRGALVSAAGASSAFDIAVGSNILDYSLPAVAYASTENAYLVVWQEHFAPAISYGIWGQIISDTGVPDPAGSFEISGQTGSGDHRKNPDVAYCRTRNEHLVVWEQRASPDDYDIGARRVTGGGQPLNPASVNVSTLGHTERNAAVAALPLIHDEGDYLVAWELEFADDNNVGVYAKTIHVAPNGDVTPGLLKTFNDPEDETNPAVAANEKNQQYLLTWTKEDYIPSFVFDGILGRKIASDGTPLGEEALAISGTLADHAAVAAGPLGDFLVVFEDQLIAAPDYNVYGRLWGHRIYLPLLLRH